MLLIFDNFFFLTVITNPKVPPGTKDGAKSFNFDYSYWSHDVSTVHCMEGRREEGRE